MTEGGTDGDDRFSEKERDHRRALVEASIDLVRAGLNAGTAGNISVRYDGGMLITPSGTPPARVSPAMIAAVPLDGESGNEIKWVGPSEPSSEWRLHRDILSHRPDIGAVVHTHSMFATVLATQHRAIPALHYMIAIFGVPTIRCTPYAPFGTQALSDLTVEYLGAGHGVLLGNHGMVATGVTLEQAMWRAGELEALAKMYYLASTGGTPVVLSNEEVQRTIERFAAHGMTARL